MKHATVFAAFLLGGCAAGYNAGTLPTPTLSMRESAVHKTLIYALSPANARIVEFDVDGKGSSKPTRRILGARTLLTGALGLQVDTDGTIYVLKASPAELLAFRPDARGNVPPERIVRLKDTDPNLTMGLALDGSGNAWVVNPAKHELLRYPISTAGSTAPTARVTLSVSANGNPLAVNPLYVAWQNGALYATWAVLYNHYTISGLSVYSVQAQHSKLTKWFIGGGNATVGANSPSLDASGNIYLTAQGRGSFVQEYLPTFKTGSEPKPHRLFGDPRVLHWIQSAAELGSVSYLATDKGIAVFGPMETDLMHPLRLISDRVDLQYANRAYGAPLLAIH